MKLKAYEKNEYIKEWLAMDYTLFGMPQNEAIIDENDLSLYAYYKERLLESYINISKGLNRLYVGELNEVDFEILKEMQIAKSNVFRHLLSENVEIHEAIKNYIVENVDLNESNEEMNGNKQKYAFYDKVVDLSLKPQLIHEGNVKSINNLDLVFQKNMFEEYKHLMISSQFTYLR